MLLISIPVAMGYLEIWEKFELRPGQSLAVRLNLILTGLFMWMEYPLFGVSLGGYGYYFDMYEWEHHLSSMSQARYDEKTIPNNVYIEVLSEIGALGAFAMVMLVRSLVRALAYPYESWTFSRIAILCILTSFLAFPTFSINFIWAFLAIILGEGCKALNCNNLVKER